MLAFGKIVFPLLSGVLLSNDVHYRSVTDIFGIIGIVIALA